jgi:hypothetical protein
MVVVGTVSMLSDFPFFSISPSATIILDEEKFGNQKNVA